MTAASVAAIRAVLRKGGLASVVVANRAAAVIAKAIAGHFELAAAALADHLRSDVAAPPSPEQALALLAAAVAKLDATGRAEAHRIAGDNGWI